MVTRAGEELAAWLALCMLPSFGPRRLWDVAASGDPEEEWSLLAEGANPRSFRADSDRLAQWRELAAAIDPMAELSRHRDAGVSVTVHGDSGHPSIDLGDPHVPPVLFWRGSGERGDGSRRPAVGIVGTRRATRAGLELATELGRDLAAAGCCVVSGLALGVDAAAHRGAMEVEGSWPVGVVGSGLDVVYPRANRALWGAVIDNGVLCSEYPLGTPPAAWRFPARNRILVSLCDALVVVESHQRGGSLITAGIAGARGVPVLAVPGSVRSVASVGTNRLIADGCPPCLSVDDVLTAVGLTSTPQLPFGRSHSEETLPDLSEEARSVLDAVGWVARSVDELADACPELSLGSLSLAVAQLLAAGVVVERDGRIERR